MAETLECNLVGVSEKWMRLMLTLANRPEDLFVCRFDDDKTARNAAHKMDAVKNNRPAWFKDVLVSVRGSEVYVVKTTRAKKVRVKV